MSAPKLSRPERSPKVEVIMLPVMITIGAIAIAVAIARWVFRINEICDLLGNIESLLKSQKTK